MRIVSGSVIVLVLAAAAYWLILPQPTHVVSVPATLGGFVKQPTFANDTAQQLKHKIVAGASGQVKNVVAAVYERKTGPGTGSGPQIIAFIGGNLTGGASAGSLIDAMTAMHGSFTTSAGKLGGQAVCAPGVSGGPAECAWADNDTFGVIVSATLGARGLAAELRQMRPLVEHIAR